MDSRAKSKSEKSLCEKSMEVVVNVIRLSSLSIAQKTLGTATTDKAEKDHSGCDYSDMAPRKQRVVADQFPESESRRSKEPQARTNPTNVIKPVSCNESPAHVIDIERVDEFKPKKEECVDGLASDYIRKMRSKLECGL